RVIIISSIFFLSVSVKIWIFDSNLFEHPTLLSLIESFSILFFSLYYFYERLKYNEHVNFAFSETFWVIFGVFILFSIMTPFLILIEIFPEVIFRDIYTINNISYILFYLFLSYSFLCKVRSI